MKNKLVIIALLYINCLCAQERQLISENNDLSLFETYISLNSEGNIFPTIYGEGLIYASNYKSNDYKLLYSDLKSESQKIKIGSKYNLGAAAIFKNEIYFTGITKKLSTSGTNNFTIYRGIIEDFKVKKIKRLPVCNLDFSYTYPTISKDGSKMLVVTNEKEHLHLLEFIRNTNNQWEKGEVIYISHPEFEIINPTFYNENTIYFASNIYDGEVTGVVYTMDNEGINQITELIKEQGSFNIYKIEKNTNNGHWGIPIKVDQFNSDFDDLGVIFINKNSGYLNSFRYSDADNIYYFELK
ncbi:hypothetical protein MHL31_11065 [Lutibacter sp. A80]|uniref:hypothetical protein n=1 Tax=Lutibacter sp. A80 TaxID=2918453 RepID=UPI001F0623B5|nr:hypothetical protein [Lutibacter sp. A80]UMB59619.1 hypothetical protein MHL31_11065 [Lutibacter sp. A80]